MTKSALLQLRFKPYDKDHAQFHWDRNDDVKDLLLSMPDLQTLDEAISQVVKCNNRLFQRQEDKHSHVQRQYTNYSTAVASSKPNGHTEVEDMQIDVVRFKPFSEQKKRGQ